MKVGLRATKTARGTCFLAPVSIGIVVHGSISHKETLGYLSEAVDLSQLTLTECQWEYDISDQLMEAME
ncbi:hypothetical protein Nepgr_006540 [Nepenthes gracilis]|uniref:Uncharacterized protein n=1 Tax=Nepenthes gracilis TaxID=150966 RepID=A0AAD3S5N4_NEPGR|nr:hypothetical protein Nepgr_006540 [Nepenthes gracilis]